MTDALFALLLIVLVLAGAAALLAHVKRSVPGLNIALTSDF